MWRQKECSKRIRTSTAPRLCKGRWMWEDVEKVRNKIICLQILLRLGSERFWPRHLWFQIFHFSNWSEKARHLLLIEFRRINNWILCLQHCFWNSKIRFSRAHWVTQVFVASTTKLNPNFILRQNHPRRKLIFTSCCLVLSFWVKTKSVKLQNGQIDVEIRKASLMNELWRWQDTMKRFRVWRNSSFKN